MKKDAAVIPMSKEILDVINAVISYGRFIRSHNYVVSKEDFDHIAEMEKYYHSLPLPDGMSKNRADFERILQIGWYSEKELERLNNTEQSDLQNISWKPKGINKPTDKVNRFVNNEECALALFEHLKTVGKIEGTEYERETILHDINNLRGIEWLEILDRNIDTKPFFDYIGGAEYPYDEFIYGSGVAPDVFLKAVLNKDFPSDTPFEQVRDILDCNGFKELWDYPTDEIDDVLDNFNENFDENKHFIAVDFYENGGYFARVFEITQEMADRFESFLVVTERGDTVLPCHVRTDDRIIGPYEVPDRLNPVGERSIENSINKAKISCENKSDTIAYNQKEYTKE